MGRFRSHISISADGYVPGPNQSDEEPLGEGGERLHDWSVPLAAWREAHEKEGGEVNASSQIIEERGQNVGAAEYLAAGLLDELEIHIAPVLLGGGARLFDDLGDAQVRLEQIRTVEAPGVTHIKYRVGT
jgi:RibD C-terminal domain